MLNTRFAGSRLVRWFAIPAFVLAAAASVNADSYTLDGVHSTVAFHIRHNNVSDIYGQFGAVSGTVKLDGDSGEMVVSAKAASINTAQPKRDEHLRSNDFFAAGQFPNITFKSTKFVKSGDGYTVTGNLSLHGVTKEITVNLVTAEGQNFEKKPVRGFTTTFTINRSDYGMKAYIPMVSDEVTLMISLQGEKD